MYDEWIGTNVLNLYDDWTGTKAVMDPGRVDAGFDP